MQQFFESGVVVDLLLLIVAVEVAALAFYWVRTGRGVRPRLLLLNAGAGVSLMLALRASLTDAAWVWVAAWLLCALVFHLADLASRWQPVKS